jgi:hypothetical protein
VDSTKRTQAHKAALQLDEEALLAWWSQDSEDDEFNGDLIEAMLAAGNTPKGEMI